jgi:4-diphosphocytidyl-2-C-methyl-D-erythritol kinase
VLRKVGLEAPAKINLYLEVGSLRPDGYHSVRTIMQTVELYDLVDVELAGRGGGMELKVKGDAPLGEENLCLRAAQAFAETAGMSLDLRISLVKRIPRAAGLGGGSSDAAAVLRALDFLLGEALGPERLLSLAASVGSDVPFFLVGGTALAEGRGERITPLVQAPPLAVILVNPGGELSTADVYRRFDLTVGDGPASHGPEALIEALPLGDIGRIAKLLHNSLQEPAMEIMPAIAGLLGKAKQAGAEGALVSGSGPTVFVLAEDDSRAAALESGMQSDSSLIVKTRFRGSGVSLRSE